MSSAKHNFHLKHDAHWHAMSTRFKGMQASRNLVDVTLSCEGRKIVAHKMVLSACSSYFDNIFEDNPCKHPVIIFKNTFFSDLEALVEFMYTGEVSVSQKNLSSFLSTADTLQVQGLIQESSNIIPPPFAVQNCETDSSSDIMLANFQASDLEEQTANDGLQFGPIIADVSSLAADKFVLDVFNNSDDFDSETMEIPLLQDAPSNDPLLIDPFVEGLGDCPAADLQVEDVNEDWWSNELKFKPNPLKASVKVKTETHTPTAPRLKIRPCSDLDDKAQLQKLLARNKKFGRVGKNCKIKTESSPPSRIQPPRTKKFAGIKYENLVKCLDDVDDKVQKIGKNKNNALSPSKNNRSTPGKMQGNSHHSGQHRASKIKSGISGRPYEVHRKYRKSCNNCPVCKKKYNYPAAMQNHVLIEHHLIPAVDKWRSLSCMKCRDSFTSRKSLIDHLFRFHYNTIVCTECKKIFTSRKMMKNHFIARHILER